MGSGHRARQTLIESEIRGRGREQPNEIRCDSFLWSDPALFRASEADPLCRYAKCCPEIRGHETRAPRGLPRMGFSFFRFGDELQPRAWHTRSVYKLIRSAVGLSQVSFFREVAGQNHFCS